MSIFDHLRVYYYFYGYGYYLTLAFYFVHMWSAYYTHTLQHIVNFHLLFFIILITLHPKYVLFSKLWVKILLAYWSFTFVIYGVKEEEMWRFVKVKGDLEHLGE